MAKLLFFSALVGLSLGIPIDNGLDGDPEVQCGPSTVQISFASRNAYQGVVYAKGHHDVPGCSVLGDGRSGGNIEMDFTACNVRRQRSLEPKGIFVTTTVVVQFHPYVLTKVDRAFHIRCFYMEADKTVDQQLEVSMVTTELRTMNVPMPVCRYEILEGGPNGLPVQFVIIGQKIYHKWTCDTETVDTFCMEVYGCTVDDGLGNPSSTISLLDADGCATDRNLLDNIEYSEPNGDLVGGKETHVFKYADRPQLYFNCQIRIGVKEPGSFCQDWREAGTGPCPAPFETLGRKKRAAVMKKRSAESKKSLGEMDVTPTRPLFVADVELGPDDIPAALRSRLSYGTSVQTNTVALATRQAGEICVTQGLMGGVLGVMAVFVVAAFSLGFALCLRSPSSPPQIKAYM